MTPDRPPALSERLQALVASLATSRPVLALYYLAVLIALALLYGRGDVSTSGFIYQAF